MTTKNPTGKTGLSSNKVTGTKNPSGSGTNVHSNETKPASNVTSAKVAAKSNVYGSKPVKDSKPEQSKVDTSRKPLPNFYPENISFFYPAPDGRTPPQNIIIESPPNMTSNTFHFDLPPLFKKITHVSIASYTVVGVPLDSSGLPLTTSILVVFPQLKGNSCSLILSSATTPAKSDAVSSSPSTLTDTCINLPITSTSTQFEYFPERILLPEFSQFASLSRVDVKLLDCRGEPITVSQLYLLLKAYGTGPVNKKDRKEGKGDQGNSDLTDSDDDDYQTKDG
ncbi:hypothetical protein BLNAU_7596 [Blattamonas nauphoetae]|uniref:Uncharacterized protein n=1 Tax=Blattamonas nauphoetae TaxID=2049346 RepID=A0ABQ9Y121_9EUKA|nr:hypothetical protein BLNAU_7596 [Blattamonas nauphoetae]